MKRIVAALMLSFLSVATSQAGLKVVGTGQNLQVDVSRFPPQMQAAYQLMQLKCVKCHSLERAVIAVRTGVAPITGTEFDKKAARSYGIKMMRKPDANISTKEAHTIVDLLCYMLDESAKK